MKSMHVVIETPQGSTEKYAWDEEAGYFMLKKILPAGMVFPFDFGFIPGSKGEDGDPLDVLVISEYKSFPGCMMECRLVGAMLAEQSDKKEKVRNDRFFFVPVLSKQFAEVEDISDLPEVEIKEIEKFFIQYNKAEGKEFKILATVSAKKAFKLISMEGVEHG
jgi:inorganic pyrophosphatase